MPYDISKYAGISRYRSLPSDKVISWITKNFDYKTRKEGTEYVICNPFNRDSGYHFNINPQYGKCHDWRGDEWAGPINPSTNSRNCSFINFVKLYRKCSYAEAVSEVLGTAVDIHHYLKPENRTTDKIAKKIISVKLPEHVRLLFESDDMQAKCLIKWLNSRGYTNNDIMKNELYHLGMDVYWPYYEFDTLVYWQSRSRLNKRFNFPSVDVYEGGKLAGKTEGTKGDFLYGFDDVEPASYLIITEAIFDKHVLGPQTLASGGAVLAPKQIGKLKILGPRKGIILSPDNDSAGIKSIIVNKDILISNGFSVYYSLPPKLEYKKDGQKLYTKDWNEIGQEFGFDKVREIHDKGITKLTESSIIKLMLDVS